MPALLGSGGLSEGNVMGTIALLSFNVPIADLMKLLALLTIHQRPVCLNLAFEVLPSFSSLIV